MKNAAALMLIAVLCFAHQATAADRPAVRTIYLVRHGAYLPDPKANPESGPGLSTLGVAQARLVATRLRAMPIAVTTVTSSTLARAQQTAAIVHEQIGDARASASALLSECTPPALAIARSSDDSAMKACQQRLDSAFATFFSPATAKHDVLVCHGNVIRYLVTKAMGADTRIWPSLSVGHASITSIEVHGPGVYRIVSVGDIGHIPANLQSWGDDSDPQLTPPELGPFAKPQ
jgi:serine/threonine-protein phosphatase PGAM5